MLVVVSNELKFGRQIYFNKLQIFNFIGETVLRPMLKSLKFAEGKLNLYK